MRPARILTLALLAAVLCCAAPLWSSEIPADRDGGAVVAAAGKGAVADERLFLLPRVYVERYAFEGNRALSDDELAAAAAPFTGREVTTEELEALRQALTLLYVRAGHINSGVIIPDQTVTDGVLTLKVIEGLLTQIDVEGLEHFRKGYIEKRLRHAAGPPVNVNDLQNALILLEQDPRIKRIKAELSPGLFPGESRLTASVEETPVWVIDFGFGNSKPPSIGSRGVDVAAAHRNLFGFGDILEGALGFSGGALDYRLGYTIPVTSRDLKVGVYFRKGESIIVEEPFDEIDIESRADTIGLSLSRPFINRPERMFTLGLAGELRRNETFLLDCPFSFTDTEDNESRETVLRFSQEWVSRSRAQVLALRSVISSGLVAFNATVTEGGMDSKFLTWLLQGQWVRQLPWNETRLVFRSSLQLANDRLLPMERFAVGGMNSVRGYRENLLVRDNGAVASLEFRVPVFRNRRGATILHLFPFADAGWSWNTKGDTPSPSRITSVGAGLEWAIMEGLDLNFAYGYAFEEVESADYDIQDDGIHFLLSWKFRR